MNSLFYAVVASLPDERMAAEYIAWLQGGHVDQVLRGGATSGIVVRLDGEKGNIPRVMTQYTFSSREAFNAYVAELAPALRADGLAKFGPERGVKFERIVGEIQ